MGFLDSLTESDVPSIATKLWINTYFQIFWIAPPDFNQQQIEKEVKINKSQYLPNKISNYALKFKKEWITNGYKISKNLDSNNYDDIIKAQIKAFGHGPDERYTAIFTSQAKYSPIEFAQERETLKKLDKELSTHFGIPYQTKISRAYPSFNEDDEPIIQARLETLWLSHKVIDRLELHSKSPSVERECFLDKGVFDFIEFYRNNLKNEKGTGVKNTGRWLKSVDKLLDKYK